MSNDRSKALDVALAAIDKAFSETCRPDGRPVAIVAKTVKGKGVSFMEHPFEWHGKAPNKDEAARALKEILGGNHA